MQIKGSGNIFRTPYICTIIKMIYQITLNPTKQFSWSWLSLTYLHSFWSQFLSCLIKIWII